MEGNKEQLWISKDTIQLRFFEQEYILSLTELWREITEQRKALKQADIDMALINVLVVIVQRLSSDH